MIKPKNIFKFACLFQLLTVISCIEKAGDVVSNECKEAVTDDASYCSRLSKNKWNSNQLIISSVKVACCLSWDMIDCNEKFVKYYQDQCSRKDYEKVHDYYTNYIRKRDNGICRHFKYYSTKCTISVHEIKTSATEEEKINLVTKIQLPSESCQIQVDRSLDTCITGTALDFGYSQDDFKDPNKRHKINCCLKWEILDCMRDVAKEQNKCSHRDVVGLVAIHDKIKANRTSLGCKDYPFGSEQCNHSSKLSINLAIVLTILIVLSGLS